MTIYLNLRRDERVGIKAIAASVVLIVLSFVSSAQAEYVPPPAFTFNERCVPYEVDHDFMRANGVDPDKILTTFGDFPTDVGDGSTGTPAPWTMDLDGGGNPVPCDEFHTHKSRTRYEGCHFYDGTPCYFTTNGQLDQDAFTDDAAGRRAFEIAEHFVFYEVVQSEVTGPGNCGLDPSCSEPSEYTPPAIFTDPFAGGFAVGTQTKIMNGQGTYFEDNPLGLWKIGFVQFTQKAFDCLPAVSSPDCDYLFAVRDANGTNSQMIGMPLIFTGDEMFELSDKGLVTIRYRIGADGVPGGQEGPRYILCPVHEDPTSSSLALGEDVIQAFPTHVEFQPPNVQAIIPNGDRGFVHFNIAYPFGPTPPQGEVGIVYDNFDCLQRTGQFCP